MRALIPVMFGLTACATQLTPLTHIDGGGGESGIADAGPAESRDSGAVFLDAGDAGGTGPDAGDSGPPDASFPAVVYNAALRYFALASADLNGDGILDLVAGLYPQYNNLEGGFDVFLGEPDGGLSLPVHIDGSDGTNVVLGDLNGDGLPDIVVTNWLAVSIFLQLSDGGYASPASFVTRQPSYDMIYAMGLGDVDGDGLLDLVVAGSGGAELHLGLGQGALGPALNLPGWALNWGQLAVADFNGDGCADLVLSGDNEGTELAVFWGGA